MNDVAKLRLAARQQVFAALLRVALGLSLLWFIGTTVIILRAQQRLSLQTDSVSLAEHEKLKAQVAAGDASLQLQVSVMAQKLDDMDKLVMVNTGKIADLATTINRAEGLGAAFMAAFTVVGWVFYRTQKEQRLQGDTGEHEIPKRPSGSHKTGGNR